MMDHKDKPQIRRLHLRVGLCLAVGALSLTAAGCGQVWQPVEVYAAPAEEYVLESGACDTDHVHVWVLQEAHPGGSEEDVVEVYGCSCGMTREVE